MKYLSSRFRPVHWGDVEHVVHIVFGQSVRSDRAFEVGVAVEILASQHPVHIGIAPRTREAGAAAAMLVDAVGEAVIRDRHHRAQERQRRPQTVSCSCTPIATDAYARPTCART